ncbi:MAG: MotA/TolQ/ExbB proton channel family protein [Castellaniella sp.]|uniref:MotA/TolQ/ExbB proton channel family protein n=1 Tax=Castellaniella sp. TaxID=1955812 RepID=UPI003C76FBA8
MIDLIGNAALTLAQAVGPDAAQAAVAVAQSAAPVAGAANQAASALSAAELAGGSQGVMHFIGQSDVVGKSLFGFLLLMSLASWYLILAKGFTHLRIRQRSRKFLAEFWAASSLEQVEHEIATHGAEEPFAHLASHAIHAQKHHAKYGALKLEESGSTAAFVTRTIRKVIDEETARLENGLTVLASVGSTAPFVGLFGTVWGVYHALLSIGMADGVTISGIAGPVGEALIMTGLGLAVAIPAVLAYNAFVRLNRVYLAQLDAFAHDLFTFLTTGQQVADDRHERHGRHITLASSREA